MIKMQNVIINTHLLSIEELSSKQDEFIFLRMSTERCVESERTANW